MAEDPTPDGPAATPDRRGVSPGMRGVASLASLLALAVALLGSGRLSDLLREPLGTLPALAVGVLLFAALFLGSFLVLLFVLTTLCVWWRRWRGPARGAG